jgi:hypothetical protein
MEVKKFKKSGCWSRQWDKKIRQLIEEEGLWWLANREVQTTRFQGFDNGRWR